MSDTILFIKGSESAANNIIDVRVQTEVVQAVSASLRQRAVREKHERSTSFNTHQREKREVRGKLLL